MIDNAESIAEKITNVMDEFGQNVAQINADLIAQRITEAVVMPALIEQEAAHAAADGRGSADRNLLLWLHAEAVERRKRDNEFHMRIRMDVESVLDKALGTEVEDGAGEGLAADVALLAERAAASEASRQAWAEEAMRLDQLAREAAELLDDIIGYVPEYFQEKWDYPAQIAPIAERAGFSRPVCAVHPDVPDLSDDEPPEFWVEAPDGES